MLARTPTLTQLPAQLATNRGEHKRGQHCPTSTGSREPDFAPRKSKFSHQLLGSIYPILQKCLTACLVTLAVHPASPTNITVTRAHGKPSFSIEAVNLSITTQGKLNLLSALTPVLKMRFSFPPWCLSSPSPFPIYSQQSDLAEAARCCLLRSLTQSAFANHFQLPGKEELARCFQTPLLSFTICYQVLRRGPLLSLERKGGSYIGPVQSSAGLLRLR